MTGVEYTALAYVFAGVPLVAYATMLWWASRSKRELGSGEES